MNPHFILIMGCILILWAIISPIILIEVYYRGYRKCWKDRDKIDIPYQEFLKKVSLDSLKREEDLLLKLIERKDLK